MNEEIVPGAPSSRAHAAFTGENGEFRRLVTRGAFFEFVTFGFYRFWLATNIRRHLWSNTSVAGDALEYTGTARELLIGFLFALAILVPVYLVYFVIGLEAERWKAFASVPLGVFYYGFWQFAIYCARRYRLTRTLWRGVPFWMTGSGMAYVLRAFGWTLLTVLTLGLAYPWRAAALERYKMGHTFYGDLPGRFEGKGWDFFKRGWGMWLSVLVALLPALLLPALVRLLAPSSVYFLLYAYFLLHARAVAFLLIFFVPIIFAHTAFKAIERKWWAEGFRFGHGAGGVRFDSDLGPEALIGNIWKMIGVGLLVFFAAGIAIWGIVAVLGLDTAKIYAPHGPPMNAFVILAAVGNLAVFFALGVFFRIYLVQRIWKIVVSSITIKNLDAAEHVVAKGEAASALGEGLADSLDVAGF
jgi:uncharacterized membrane protein YjgN (DUF898 family)